MSLWENGNKTEQTFSHTHTQNRKLNKQNLFIAIQRNIAVVELSAIKLNRTTACVVEG